MQLNPVEFLDLKFLYLSLILHWSSVWPKESRKQAQISRIQRWSSTSFLFETHYSLIYLPGQCVFWSPHSRGKLVVASILCFIELHFLYLNLSAQISYSIGILSVIQGYRGDLHHPSFILMYGSWILVEFGGLATLAGACMLAREDGGAGHRPIARSILDRWMLSRVYITTVWSYDFY
jgi:hypothetical protein